MTHAGPISDAEDDPPLSTEPLLVATAPEAATDLFQCMVILTESMNSLKRCVNSENQSHRNDLAHLEPISSDEEELPVPVASVPIPSLPLGSDQLPMIIGVPHPVTSPPAHILTLSDPSSTLLPPAPQSLP